MTITIEEMATFCKKKGFVYPSSEIYGGFAGFFDLGPLGVELGNNIKQHWWKSFVKDLDNVVGIDGTIVSPFKVWKASGHVDSFSDKMIFCKKNKKQFRADNLVEEVLEISADGLSKEDLLKLIKQNITKFKKAGYELVEEISDFNLMFSTKVGVGEDNTAFLRGETAQIIFTNFKNVLDTSRLKLPFGIAQIGKAFRNEISPREFLFRVREFEQMEMEFFVHPKQINHCELLKQLPEIKLNLYSADDQKKKRKHKSVTLDDLLKLSINKWHAYWLMKQYLWFLELGIDQKNIRIREHLPEELAHYAKACFDIEYNFPMGWREIYGNADRGQFDLTQHQQHSKQKLEYFDENTKEKVVPYVASEPSQGVGRAFLAFMFDAYDDDKKRGNIVLRLSPKLAPFYCAVFPLVKNKPEVVAKAKQVYAQLKSCYSCLYDEAASVGRRYARADEMGVPYCITIDFDSLEDDSVTIRNRDDTKQERIKIEQLNNKLFELYLK